MMTALTVLALVQAFFYMLTGVWPLVSMGTFVKVTGPKTDLWLVKTVGALVAVVGVVIVMAAARAAITLEIAVLAVGCAAGLAIIDCVYVAKKVIARIYLLDAVAEVLLILCWLLFWNRY